MILQFHIRRFHTFLMTAFLVVSGASSLACADETENWLGTLDVKVAKLRIQLELKIDAEGNCTGNMISLDQGAIPIKLDRVVRTKDKLEFEIKKLATKYSGTLNDDQSVASGTFTQGQAFELVFKRVADVKPDKHIQSWKGTLKAGAQSFDFQFRVFEDSEGNHVAKLDSFTEKLTGIPCEVSIDNNEVTLSIPATAAKLVGELSEDKQTLDGHWLQGGGKFPITLKKIPLEQTRRLDLKRPQTPKPPFDYAVSEFTIDVKEVDPSYDASFNLAGTLTMPKSDGPFPVVILISGSGPQDRDETIYEHKPFLVIADHLTKNGFAVLRYDERGVGESTGEFASATTADFAQDVETLVKWASKQPKLDPEKIILAGHSEGGLVAPMVASRNEAIAGVIMLAGPGVSGGKIIIDQSRKIAAVAGAPENVIEMQDGMLNKLVAQIEADKPFDDEFRASLAKEFSGLSEEQTESFGAENVVDATLAKLGSPWMRFFVAYDPQEALTKTKCPILSLIGENDLQVTPELNLSAIESAVKSGGNSDFVQKQLPKLNHLFQVSETGSPSEYVQIEETIDPSLLDEMTSWLKERF